MDYIVEFQVLFQYYMTKRIQIPFRSLGRIVIWCLWWKMKDSTSIDRYWASTRQFLKPCWVPNLRKQKPKRSHYQRRRQMRCWTSWSNCTWKIEMKLHVGNNVRRTADCLCTLRYPKYIMLNWSSLLCNKRDKNCDKFQLQFSCIVSRLQSFRLPWGPCKLIVFQF